MIFPDSTTSREVMQAWDAATAGMPEGDRMIYELQMMFPVLSANAVTAPDGSFSHFLDFDDPNWVNPLKPDCYSFVKVIPFGRYW